MYYTCTWEIGGLGIKLKQIKQRKTILIRQTLHSRNPGQRRALTSSSVKEKQVPAFTSLELHLTSVDTPCADTDKTFLYIKIRNAAYRRKADLILDTFQYWSMGDHDLLFSQHTACFGHASTIDSSSLGIRKVFEALVIQ